MANMDKLVQWNCRSIINKKHEIIHIINTFNPFIFSLSETWLKPDFVFKIPGYSCLREDRADGYGGVCLLIRNSSTFSSFPLPSHSNCFSVIAAIVDGICFVSIYVPHPSLQIFNEIKNLISVLPRPFMILGDFNSHHTSWGSSVSNSYGYELLDILDMYSLCILNSGSPTRLTKPGEVISAIDLSICTPQLASSLSWSTLCSTYNSDHYPIIISFPCKKKDTMCIQNSRLKHKIIDSKWSQYTLLIEEKINNCSEVNVIDNNYFKAILLESADNVFPKKKPRSNKLSSPPWWDEECTNAIQKRKAAERNYRNNMSMKNYEALMTIMKEVRKLFKKKKFDGWRKFCSTISPETHATVIWRNIKRFRSAVNPSNALLLPIELADQFLDRLAPPSAPLNDPILSYKQYNSDAPSLNLTFTLVELKGVLNHVKDSAPGEDGIPYSFLSHLGEKGLNYFLNLINKILLTGDIPPSWRSQIVLPFLKPSKVQSDIKSYRPIVLSSVITKVVEHLIKNRLEWYIENNEYLSQTQFGFRKGKSVGDNLGILVTDIRNAFSDKKSVVAAFLDINSAYDNVLLHILKSKLDKLKVPYFLTNSIVNLLSERKIILDVGGPYKPSRLVWRGLPQGSVLSPLLYNIYTYDLEGSVGDSASLLQYADDLVIYASDMSVSTAERYVSSSLSLLKIWMDANGLDLSPSKSTVVLFTKSRTPCSLNITYDGDILPIRNQVKFLGAILDSKLTGQPHCEFVVSKCERNLNMLRCLGGVWWGAHPATLRLVYNAVIRSVLDFGTFFLDPGNVAGFRKLDLMQSRALRIVSGAMKSSPVNALQIECCDPPLNLRRQYLSDRFIFRIVQFHNHPLISKLEFLSKKVPSSHKPLPCLLKSFLKFKQLQAPTHSFQVLPLFGASYDSLLLSPVICFSLGIEKSDFNANENFNCNVNSKWPNWHQIYTDASKHSSGCVGVGVYHKQYNIVQKIKLPPESSVFTGECFGLLKALEYVLSFKLKKTVVFTDSLSALQSLAKFSLKLNPFFHVIFECKRKLLHCQSHNYLVSFCWVPSHCGISGNVKADSLANSATVTGDVYPYKNFGHDLAALPGICLHKSWNMCWEESGRIKGRFLYAIQSSVPRKPWFAKLSFGKTATSTIIRMRLGHNSLPVHLHKLGIVTGTACECGESYCDLNHIFFACSLYDHSSLYTSLVSVSVPLPTNISLLLRDFNPLVYSILSRFILNNNIKL
uniref:Pol-like protein n=1 Tax=Bombyx mori TaxID=7091 RepID=A0A8R2M084_BOMMO|nr:uncharacterized protein LOC101744291 isoform X1 [Bombyx mori]XP_037870304.1 uncharacterized protein LOC101744291 isoform X2 [Bombyx mori]